MNIFKREIKLNLKPFIFWMLGMVILIFAGIVKYKGVEASGGIDFGSIIDKFPRIVLAIIGIIGIDPYTPGGYYSIISYYIMITACIYAVSLGVNAVSREILDKTHEFIFTKPRKRSFILLMKMATAFIYLFAFCVLSYLVSIGAVTKLKITENINFLILLFSITVFLVAFVFFEISALLSVLLKDAQKAALYCNLVFLFSFAIGIICDILQNAGPLRVLAPLKYFLPADLLDNRISIPYLILCLVLIILCNSGVFIFFKRKDLKI
jgi:ABC-2 type transport system permease protein